MMNIESEIVDIFIYRMREFDPEISGDELNKYTEEFKSYILLDLYDWVSSNFKSFLESRNLINPVQKRR